MTKYEKEVWIRFADIEAYSEHREKLFELLDKAHGECETKIYLQNTNECKSLYEHYFDDERLSLLTDVYGAENVKIVDKPVKARSQRDIIECCGNCIERIADALERIACALDGESRMNGNRVICLADAPDCAVASVAFYDRYREKIAGIRTAGQRNDILSDMQQDFATEIRKNPQNRDKLSEVYQLLKRRCWEAV